MKETVKFIGNTPMYHIENTNIYIKLEKYNIGGSVKDRAVLYMLEQLRKDGVIKEQTKLIEATSGNTGIALAMLGAVYQIPVTIIMPDSMSVERRALIKAYGATLVLSEGKKGMPGAIALMEEMKKDDKHYISLNQFDNDANRMAHYETTAKEIIEQVKDIDIFAAGVGTGGTFSGVAKRLKEYNKDIFCVAGEPMQSAVMSGHEKGPHKIQGIGAGFVPSILDRELIDDIMMIDDQEAVKETMEFAKHTGILVGISSGANLVMAKRLASYYPDKIIVTIAPDGGEKYLSSLPFGE